MSKYDFSGWATRANMRCSDGKVIGENAFKDDDGKTVPLVWMHNHTDPTAVMGFAKLENREGGVYAHCSFNDTEAGQLGREMVRHGDVTSLSICAKTLRKVGSLVQHGEIKEVSLVLAGANPGAHINTVMCHDDDTEDAIICCDVLHLDVALEDERIEHAEKEDGGKTVKEIFDSMTEEQKTVAYYMIGMAKDMDEDEDAGGESSIKHADETGSSKTVKEIFDSMTEEQQSVVYFLMGEAASMEDEEDDETGGETMKHNLFEGQETPSAEGLVIMHSDGTLVETTEVEAIFKDAKRYGTLKESCIEHGIDNVDYLFPDAQNLTNVPAFIQDSQDWVKEIMSGVHRSPFSRVKSIFADITEDDARAKGYYQKGKFKKEEFFSLMKRTTSPTTVYKKQKMDRDDVIDITDFDVVTWLKGEMRLKLDEELARAFLLGDGRLASSDDKISEEHIRPIAKDDDLFTIHVDVQVQTAATDDEIAKAYIREVIKARKGYKGSGNPILFTTEDMLTNMLLLTDEIGRDLYADETALARKMRVRKIVAVPPMEETTGKNGNPLVGVLINLNDYNVGADKGGAVNMFDDFDIDYNQQKYLIETRCSGALTIPFSAIALELKKQG